MQVFSDNNLDWLLDQLQLRLIYQENTQFQTDQLYWSNEEQDENDNLQHFDIATTDTQSEYLCQLYGLTDIPKHWVRITKVNNVYSVQFHPHGEKMQYRLPFKPNDDKANIWWNLVDDIEDWLGIIAIIEDHLPLPEHDKMLWIETQLNATKPMGCPDYETVRRSPISLMIGHSWDQHRWVQNQLQANGIDPAQHVLPHRMVAISDFGDSSYNITYFDNEVPTQAITDDLPTQIIPDTIRAWRKILYEFRRWLNIKHFLKFRYISGG